MKFSTKLSTGISPRGFTLVELLVVIAILGIISAIGIASFLGVQEKARDSKRKSDLDNITRALELYYNDYDRYPADNSGKITGCGTAATATDCNWGVSFSRAGFDYMLELPADPTSHYYVYRSTGTGYQLYALLENTEDGDIIDPGDITDPDPVCNSAGDLCNYAISSPNATP